MTIAGMAARIKQILARVPREALVAAIAILSMTGSFGLGFLTAREMQAGQGSEIWIEDVSAPSALPAAAQAAPKTEAERLEKAAPAIPAGGQYVASKSGSRYYLPWCSGASRIKEENKVWFASKEEAEAAGYTPALNCKGL